MEERWDEVEWSPSNVKLDPAANLSTLEMAIIGPLIQRFVAKTICDLPRTTRGGQGRKLPEASMTLYSAYARPKREFSTVTVCMIPS